MHRLALDNLLHTYGDDTLLSGGAVVGHDEYFVRPLGEFIAEDEQDFVACREDGDDAVSGFLQGLSNRQHRCSSYSATGADDGAVVLDTRSFAQRSDHIVDGVTRVEREQLTSADAYLLHDEGDRSAFDIGSGDCERHPFGLRVHTDDDKVTGAATTCDKRRFYYQFGNVLREETFGNNLIHRC